MRKMLAALFLALIAGFSPAIAQAPPPVPALPDAERRTTYTLSASTCACSVGFQLYGDSTDYANWLTVWVNGVQIPQAGNWTISSPSGSLATLPRPITNAVLTFLAPQTGTVQIVGARRPRRTSQVTENRGVSARDFNQIISDLEAQTRELWDRQARTVQAPPGDTLNVLPILASRANMGACFDSGGNLTSCVGIAGSSLIAGNGIALTGVGPTTITNNIVAGTGIRFTGSNPITISASAAPYVTPTDYSFTCDGVTNFATQLQAMITGSAGKTIYIPPGPACITGTTLSLPANTNIIGADREFSIIKGTGAAVPVFSAANVSNITLSNFWCQGSDQVTSWAVSSTGCLLVTQGSPVATSDNIKLRRMKISGFNANYWLKIVTTGSALSMSGVEISDSLFQSFLADVPTDVTPGNNGNYAIAIFSASGGFGQVINPVIRNNQIDGQYLCFGAVLYGNHLRPVIEGNLLSNFASADINHCVNGFGTGHNSYPILVYDNNADGFPPSIGRIENNTIFRPWSTGIYLAGDGTHSGLSFNDWRFLIAGNLIYGQQSDEDTSLARAAIVINNATNVSAIGNKTDYGFGGITAVGQWGGSIVIKGNTCVTATTSASIVSCIKVSPYGGATDARYMIKNNVAQLLSGGSSGGSAILASSATGNRIHTLEISDNTIMAEWNGLSASSQYVTNSFTVKGNKFGGKADNVMANVSANSGAPVAIVGNIFDSADGVAGNGLLAGGATIHMTGNKFINRASGVVAMFRADGTCGTITGTQFNNVVQPAQVYAGSLGLANPSGCTLNYLDFVQNLTPSEAGAGGSKYVEFGWLHASTTTSTTHLPQRALTGN